VVDDPKWQQSYVRLYWQVLSPVPDNPRPWPLFFSETGVLIEDPSQRPMVVPLWYPPSQWQPGETIVTETLPWDLGMRFNIGLAVLQGTQEGDEESGPATAFADPARRLPITTVSPGAALFHGNTWAQVGAFARDGRRLVPITDDLFLSPLGVTFAEGIQLVKYQISNPKSQTVDSHSPVLVVLQWQAATRISRDYTVFVHLVAPDGTIVAQSDARPTWVVPWPTDRWLSGRPVLDGHQLSLPSDLPAGRYQVRVGLYYWETLERLPVLNEALQPVSDHVVLGGVQIDP
jgi:hypothetical protein